MDADVNRRAGPAGSVRTSSSPSPPRATGAGRRRSSLMRGPRIDHTWIWRFETARRNSPRSDAPNASTSRSSSFAPNSDGRAAATAMERGSKEGPNQPAHVRTDRDDRRAKRLRHRTPCARHSTIRCPNRGARAGLPGEGRTQSQIQSKLVSTLASIRGRSIPNRETTARIDSARNRGNEIELTRPTDAPGRISNAGPIRITACSSPPCRPSVSPSVRSSSRSHRRWGRRTCCCTCR